MTATHAVDCKVLRSRLAHETGRARLPNRFFLDWTTSNGLAVGARKILDNSYKHEFQISNYVGMRYESGRRCKTEILSSPVIVS